MKGKVKTFSIRWQALLNKYALSLIFFILWISFFDRHSLLYQIKLYKERQNLAVQKEYYQKQIQLTLQRTEEIDRNKEKFAREAFFMHRDDEDIYIFEAD